MWQTTNLTKCSSTGASSKPNHVCTPYTTSASRTDAAMPTVKAMMLKIGMAMTQASTLGVMR